MIIKTEQLNKIAHNNGVSIQGVKSTIKAHKTVASLIDMKHEEMQTPNGKLRLSIFKELAKDFKSRF